MQVFKACAEACYEISQAYDEYQATCLEQPQDCHLEGLIDMETMALKRWQCLQTIDGGISEDITRSLRQVILTNTR